jgi:hypothetical protein
MAVKPEDLPKKMEDLLNAFRRKKQALGLVRENEMWRIRYVYNEELHR